MGKTRTIRLEGVEDDEAETATQEAQDFADADEMEGGELFRVTEELRGTANVRLMIVRTYPNTPDMAGHVGDLTPSEFSIERMRELYGPGRYRVRVVGPKGFLKGGGPVHIARTHPENPAASTATGSGGASEVMQLLKTLQDQEAARRAESAQRRDRWIELAIPGLLTVLATVLGKSNAPDYTALIAAMKPAPGPTIADLTQSLSNLKSLTEKDDSDGKLETILKVMEFAKGMTGDGGSKEGSNWLDVVRDLLKEGPGIVGPLLENMRTPAVVPSAPAMSVAVRPASPLPPASPAMSGGIPDAMTSPPPVVTPAPPSEGTDMMAFALPIIRQQLAKLLTWAAQNKRVELYAEVFLDELPAIVHSYVTAEQALAALKREDWYDHLVALDPRLKDWAATREWLDAMRRELIEIIEEQIRNEAGDESATEENT